jgi:hypothetical protein
MVSMAESSDDRRHSSIRYLARARQHHLADFVEEEHASRRQCDVSGLRQLRARKCAAVVPK